MFDKITDVPAPIADCYYEDVRIEPTGNTIDKVIQIPDSMGNETTTVIQVPEYVDVKYVVKKPAYWENGGHIDAANIAKWDFHERYVEWIAKAAEIEVYNNTPQFDEDGNELAFDKLTIPPEPTR
ncbi:hypothetical protein [Photobacterium nomapromontoriensis]|uniref:hypothetical protein n=1 Tax=Photobacterium nomapromontoriensis TaxID=2910237 RepID=UPI003D0B6EF4